MPEPESSRKRSRSPSESDGQPTKRANTGLDEPRHRSASPSVGAVGDNGEVDSMTVETDAGQTPPPAEEGSPSGSPSTSTVLPGTDGSGPPSTSATIHLRCLIVTQDASIIIGKAGAHVNEIREKSGARVVVSESTPGNPERILNVSGPLDAVSKAFGLIVRRINDEPFDVASVPGSRAVTIKFMIPNSRMGSVIGKGGAKIKEIQEASGARLNASEGMLPNSNERVLSVAGVADAIHIATYYIGNILIEAQERQPGITFSMYKPIPHSSSSSTQYVPRTNNNNNNNSHSHGGSRGPPPGHYQNSGGSTYIPAYASSYPPPPPPPAPMPAGPLQTQQIYIPNDLVGCIIGKGGSKINEIRGQSQSTIKIMEPGAVGVGVNGAPSSSAGAADDRLVVVTGPAPNVQMAVGLLYARLEEEKRKQLRSPV